MKTELIYIEDIGYIPPVEIYTSESGKQYISVKEVKYLLDYLSLTNDLNLDA